MYCWSSGHHPWWSGFGGGGVFAAYTGGGGGVFAACAGGGLCFGWFVCDFM